MVFFEAARLASLTVVAFSALACSCTSQNGPDSPDGSGATSTGAAAGVGGDAGDGGVPGAGGDGSSTGGHGGSSGGSPGTGGAPATPGRIDGEVYVEPCPAEYPGLTSCDTDGAVCTFGNAGRLECRVSLTCSGGLWTAAPACVPAYPTDECPSEASVGGACDPEGSRCSGANGRECSCVMGMWNCDAPVIGQPNCLPLAPNTGTACSSNGTVCQYTRCNVAGTIVGASCQEGTWTTTSTSCMSSD